MAVVDDAAHPVAARPRDAEDVRARASGTPTTIRSSSYYLPDDFSQARDLAAEHPEKVDELKKLFWEDAEKYHVMPLLGGLARFFGILPPLRRNTTFTYYGDVQNVAPGMIPRIYNHSYTISADLHIPPGRRRGRDRRRRRPPRRVHALRPGRQAASTPTPSSACSSTARCRTTPLPTGGVNVRMEFAADAPKPATGGEVTLFVERRDGRRRADGSHRPVALLRLRRPRRRPRQRPARRPQPTSTSRRSRSPARSRRSSSTSTPPRPPRTSTTCTSTPSSRSPRTRSTRRKGRR